MTQAGGLFRRARSGTATRADAIALALGGGVVVVGGLALYSWLSAPKTGRKYMNDDQERFAEPFSVAVDGRTIAVQPATPADIASSAACLASANVNEPVLVQCGAETADVAAREGALRWLYGVMLRAALPSSTGSVVLRTAGSEATAVWFPKGGDISTNALANAGAWAYIWKYSGWERRGRFPGYSDAIKLRRHRIMAEHEGAFFYLLTSGVRPDVADARSYHTAVVQPVLDLADALGMPCYVEATSEATRDFFTSLGFAQVEAFLLFGFIVFPMKREARVRASAAAAQ